MLDSVVLAARTARHLRIEQLAVRSLRTIQRVLPAPASPARARLREDRLDRAREALLRWGPDEADAVVARADAIVAGDFTFVGVRQSFEPIDWAASGMSPLWTYHLHYFDYALDLAWAGRMTGRAVYAAAFEGLASSWIAGTDRSSSGWDAYPTSIRVVNWLLALSLFGDAIAPDTRARVALSITEQVNHLRARLEWDVSANHLQKNLWALCVAAMFFDGEDAARWRSDANRWLWRELDEQILGDGMQFERSPMYHAEALADLLVLIGLARSCGEAVPDAVVTHARRMLLALRRLSRPDGSLHLFNDSANGEAPSTEWLLAVGADVCGEVEGTAEGPWQLPAAGYHGWSNGATGDTGERIAIDAGGPGPDHQPGHAHCDLLGFELDLAGRPVIVDSGVSGYAGDPLREYVRSTRAHNTVMIDGREQSEVWGVFRMARRASMIQAESRGDHTRFEFSGACRPFHSDRMVHRRLIRRSPDGTWLIADIVQNATNSVVESFLHLHPDLDVSRAGGVAVAPLTDRMELVIEPFGIEDWRIERGRLDPPQGWYCSRFGESAPAPVLVCTLADYDLREFGFRISVRDRAERQ